MHASHRPCQSDSVAPVMNQVIRKSWSISCDLPCTHRITIRLHTMSALLKPFSKLSVRASTSALPALSTAARAASTSVASSSSSSSTLDDLSLVVPRESIPRRPDFPATYPGPSHKHINQPKFLTAPPASEFPARIGENEEGRRELVSLAITGMRGEEMRGLRRYTVVLKRVVKMTKKGKM